MVVPTEICSRNYLSENKKINKDDCLFVRGSCTAFPSKNEKSLQLQAFFNVHLN